MRDKNRMDTITQLAREMAQESWTIHDRPTTEGDLKELLRDVERRCAHLRSHIRQVKVGTIEAELGNIDRSVLDILERIERSRIAFAQKSPP
jgi:hypothetical protein